MDLTGRIFVGAEAEVARETFLDGPAVAKRRLVKSYRHPDLDRRLRRERTRLEAQLIAEARVAGVPVPYVLDVDVVPATLRMSDVGGARLREVIEQSPARAAEFCREFGCIVARLHAARIVHGDLTTSNVHVNGDRLVLLDFGLAGRGDDVEDRGVDLHLAERTFEASHADQAHLFEAFLAGYREALPEAESVIRRMNDIKARARYA